MYLVNRIYADRVGHRDAFYRDVLIDFVNNFTNQPESSVIQLSNAGGKTTLLSMFYCCFEPAKKEWIQTRQTSNFKFKDYFTDDLALIAIELVTDGKKMVIGQYVKMKAENDEYRYFFSFEPEGNFVFDAIPCMSRKNAETIQDVQKWVHDSTVAHPGNFYHTTNQGTWKEHLTAKGFDLWLISKQMQFCHSEGGILKFSEFKNEEQFLAAFYAMVIDAEQTTEVTKVLTSAMHDHNEMPRKKRQAALLESVYQAWEPLYKYSKDFFEISKAHRLALIDTIIFNNGLTAVFENFERQVSELENNQERLEKSKSEAEKTIKDADMIYEATHAAWFDARIHEHEKRELQFKEDINQMKLTNAKLSASIKYQDKAGAEAGFRLAKKLQKEMEQEGASLLEAKQVSEAKLHFKYLHESKNAQADIDKKSDEIKQLQEICRTYEIELIDARKKAARLDFELDQISKEKEAIVQEVANRRRLGQLEAGETINEAITRLTNRLKQLTADLLAKENKLLDLRKQEKELKGEVEVIKSKLGTLHNEENKITHWLEQHIQEQGRLCNLSALKTLSPDGEVRLTKALSERVNARESELKINGEKLRHQVNQLNADINRLEKHGSMLVDDNIQVALNYLHEHDISEHDVMAFPSYLMGLYEDEAKIKKIIESDPGRYLGIVIINSEVIDKIESLVTDIDVLHRPVMASLYDGELGDVKGIILPPADPCCYSEVKLAKKLSLLKEELSDARGTLDKNEQQQKQFGAAAIKLEHYLQSYPADVVKNKEDAAKQKGVEIQEAVNELALIEERFQIKGEEISDIESLIPGARQKCQETERQAGELTSFDKHSYSPAMQRIKKIPEIKGQLSQQEARTSELSNKISGLSSSIDAEQSHLNRYTSRRDQYKNQADEYQSHDLVFAKEDQNDFLGLDASALLGQLRQCENAYLAQSRSESADRVRRDVESAGRLLKEKTADFDTEFTELRLSEQDMPDIQMLSARNKKELFEEMKGNKSLLDEQQAKRNANSGLQKGVEREKANFKQHRTYPDFNTIAPEVNNDSQPSEFRKAAENYQVKSKETSVQLQEISKSINENGKLLGNVKSNANTIEMAQNTVAQAISQVPELVKEISAQVDININEARDIAKDHQSKCNELARKKNEKYRSAELSLKNIRSKLNTSESQEQLPNVCVQFMQFEILNAESRLDVINLQLDDYLSTLKHQLAEDESQFELRLTHVLDHVDTALKKLDQAVNFSRIPKGHPLAGGKSVLKNKFKNNLTESERRAKVKSYIDRLMSDQENNIKLPTLTSASDLLTARLAMCVAQNHSSEQNPFGLEFIKIGNTISYQPISLSGGSGAQKLIQSLLLYLSLACMRQRVRRSSTMYGGFLFLDNPFAQMNHAQMVSSGVLLAKTLGYQLCFFTGHRDANAFESFNKIISMCNTNKYDKANHRYLVEIEEEVNKGVVMDNSIGTIMPTSLDINELSALLDEEGTDLE